MVEVLDKASSSVLLVLHLKDFHIGTPALCDYLSGPVKEG